MHVIDKIIDVLKEIIIQMKTQVQEKGKEG
jgi:hypothetical protein